MYGFVCTLWPSMDSLDVCFLSDFIRRLLHLCINDDGPKISARQNARLGFSWFCFFNYQKPLNRMTKQKVMDLQRYSNLTLGQNGDQDRRTSAMN